MFRSMMPSFLKDFCLAGICSVQKIRLLLNSLVVLFFLMLVASSPSLSQTPVFINEIHYDNTGADAGEAIEVAGPAGTDLTGWSIVRYNGATGAVYTTPAATETFSGTIPDLGDGFGVVVLNYPQDGLQNGSPDGIALVNASNAVVQFLSYEGSFTAVGGPANGMVSTDIVVSEVSTTPIGQSLQLSGTGANYEDFTWNSPATATFGAFNTGQTFVGGELPPSVSSTTPTNGATGVAINTDITINFSEAVDVTGSWFLISGSSSGAHTATVSGGPQSFTLNPDLDFTNNETVTVTVFAANVTDQDTDDPPDNMDADHIIGFTTISATAAIVINEIHADPDPVNGDANGDGTVSTSQDEFVELVNTSGAALDISGWTLSDAIGVKHTFPSGTILPDQTAIVIFGGGTPTGSFGCSIVQTASSGGLGLNNTGGETVTVNDGVSNVASYTYGNEGGDNQSLTRAPDITGAEPLIKHTAAPGANGALFSPGRQVGGSNFPGCGTEIFEIQGSGLASPFATQIVTTNNNVVTALAADGFFMQTPTARSDGNAQTSDGIFVFTSSAPAVSVGDFVNVTGEVKEFFNFTEFSTSPTVTIVSSGNPLPAPAQLDGATPTPNQPAPTTELERFEGMLVEIASGVVGGPNQFFSSDQTAEVFIVAGNSRPFREPGILFPGLSGLPVWDGNPEVFELDPDRLGQPNATIPAGSTFSATGVLGFEFNGYELWPTQYSVNAVALPRAVRALTTGEATLATLNMHRFFDTVNDPNIDDPVPTAQQYANTLNKFSMYIRDVLRAPNVLAVQEAENITVLQDLANKINADDATLTYTPYLQEGNDIGGIDVGFLVRNGVTVNSVTQLGKTELFTFDNSLLHDRPPLVLDAILPNGSAVVVMNLHQRSLGGIDDPTDGPRVRQKRHEQAVSVSNMVQNLQTAQPTLNLVVTGDFNAFQFTDGYVHVLGQIMGTPADASQALIPGSDNVNPDLINKVVSLPAAEQYSFIFGGSAQVLDHMLVSQALNPAVTGIEYARGNADAAVKFETDGTTPLRASDHDGLVLYVVGAPVANAGDDKAICAGGSTTIGGAPAASGGGGGPYTFSWSPADGLSATNVANPTASPATTTTYTLTVTETATQLTDTDEVTVTITSSPTVTFIPVGPYCLNDDPVDLAGFVSPSGGAFSGNGISGNMFSPANAGAGTHTITYTLTGTCSGSASQQIVVHPLPGVTFNSVGPFFVSDAAVDLSSAVSPTGGTFSGPGISGNMFDPAAAGVGTHHVTYTFTDANTCSNGASRDIVVSEEPVETNFVFLAEQVTLDRHDPSEGNIHSNNHIQIKKGAPSSLTGNLSADDNIIIQSQNTVNGNVKAGGDAIIENGVVINGTVREHTGDNEVPLPDPSFSAGGCNCSVLPKCTLELPPGKYGSVLVGAEATLFLRHDGKTGEYFFNILDTDRRAIISIDVRKGPVEINVVNKLEFDQLVRVVISSGDAGSKKVTFASLQKTRLMIGRKARVLGNIIVPDATVRLFKGSRFRGAIAAEGIYVEPGAVFRHHDSPSRLPGIPEEPTAVDDVVAQAQSAPGVTDYELIGNYPNPFNPSTEIRFAMPEAGAVTLRIYSLNGRLVRTLVNGNYASGKHQIVWDAKDEKGSTVATGMYFYQLVVQKLNGAAAFAATKRMMLVK
jgi:predicted extracellular nuclease/cytoskeletal protein CcmA (bactofilin family)